MFAVVNGVLLRGFSFPDADRLVDVQFVDPTNFQPGNFNSRVTTMDYKELDELPLLSFAAITASLNGSTVNVTYQGQPKRYTGGYISHDFFRTLGVSPALGRDFLPEHYRPGVDKAVILGDALWTSSAASTTCDARSPHCRTPPRTPSGPSGFSRRTKRGRSPPVSRSLQPRPRNSRTSGRRALRQLRPGGPPMWRRRPRRPLRRSRRALR